MDSGWTPLNCRSETLDRHSGGCYCLLELRWSWSMLLLLKRTTNGVETRPQVEDSRNLLLIGRAGTCSWLDAQELAPDWTHRNTPHIRDEVQLVYVWLGTQARSVGVYCITTARAECGWELFQKIPLSTKRRYSGDRNTQQQVVIVTTWSGFSIRNDHIRD